MLILLLSMTVIEQTNPSEPPVLQYHLPYRVNCSHECLDAYLSSAKSPDQLLVAGNAKGHQ
jgi:hypothetical protein